MDRANVAARRSYAKRRKIGIILVVGSFALFIAAALLVKDTSAPYGWTIWISFALFMLCSVAFLSLTRCPFCGRTIVVGSMFKKNCPHCKKSLVVPEAKDPRSRALEKRSGR